ncbi:GNAT family N-acetyltransferase [Mesorhizobium sp. NBSH29]|uniref:GNAT family N-acetyltransferase n=1 Tax=Mesorhizobium sp. NBSH29 TaxID=2654249 RepID=UPI001896969A|nr:GNAT family N-acetyltransferase [Mesorhizobium sp. NBSH29]QPC85895.1 GNAT family N-acetyltransferase [Mesorhizobium sp. NBSH29]
MIVVAVEEKPGYVETARLAAEAFASADSSFDPEHLRWFYEDCFTEGTTIVGLTDTDTGQKIGQIALVRQSVLVNGKPEPAAELVDLFVLKQWRGRERVQMLYDEVGRQFAKQKLRFAFGMPNAKALPVNERFFDLKGFLRLELRAGIALPWLSASVIANEPFDRLRRDHFVALFDQYATSGEETGLRWDGEALFRRLCGLKYSYAIHATEGLLLISSARLTRSVPYTLLAAFLRRSGVTPTRADVRSVTRAAAAFWKRPQFIFAGLNRTLPFIPGIPLPDRVRPSPMILQMRDFAPERTKLEFDRFQLIDFDFA